MEPECFRKIRKLVLELSQSQLAEVMRVSPQSISVWERGQKPISGQTEKSLIMLSFITRLTRPKELTPDTIHAIKLHAIELSKPKRRQKDATEPVSD